MKLRFLEKSDGKKILQQMAEHCWVDVPLVKECDHKLADLRIETDHLRRGIAIWCKCGWATEDELPTPNAKQEYTADRYVNAPVKKVFYIIETANTLSVHYTAPEAIPEKARLYTVREVNE